MPYFGCHLSPSGGYAAMVCTAVSLGADTVQFFTRNPRGSRAKAPDLEDAAQAGALMGERGFGPIVAHGAYTMNLCTRDPEARAFAAQVLTEDLERTTLLPGCLYNFHPGSHVGQGLQEGVRQIAAALEGALATEPTACVLLETCLLYTSVTRPQPRAGRPKKAEAVRNSRPRSAVVRSFATPLTSFPMV